MVFSSLLFLFLFLPLNFFFYFLSTNQTYRNWVLIIFSLAFYAWGEPVWVFMLVFTISIDYFNALIIEKYLGQWQSKAALVFSLVLNLALLGFFKYSGFLVDNINALLGTAFHFKAYGLPVGISFYTFQTISYVLDVYRGEVPAQRSLPKLLLFVSLFHQLVAGPIVRYQDIAAEIEHRVFKSATFNEGINRFIVGLGKKVILANTVGEVGTVFLGGNLADLPILGAWFGITLFALQIYFDFSGYSDMAIGLGKMFGFTYKENFDYPYISRSATEFWRRWHMSLGSFFRDYVYIPLGGNRQHALRNLLVVWFLTGLWHGASWNFVLWGLYYGALIALERMGLMKLLNKLPRVISHLYLVLITLVGWAFFYYTDLSKAWDLLGVMFGFGSRAWIDANLALYFYNNATIFFVALVACTPVMRLGKGWVKRHLADGSRSTFVYAEIIRPCINLAILTAATVLLVGKTYNPFLYFRF